MPYRSLHQPAIPSLTAGEWRDVQSALRAVGESPCAKRGLARIMPGLRPSGRSAVAPELEPLRDFLCESARNGPGIDKLAERLGRQGYSAAQIAALSLIAG